MRVSPKRGLVNTKLVASVGPWNKYAFYVNLSLGEKKKKKGTVLGVRTCILDHPFPKGESSQHGTVHLGRPYIDAFIS